MERIYLCSILILLAACVPTGQLPQSQTLQSQSLSCQQDSEDLQSLAIYGEDNRLDWYQQEGMVTLSWARSSVALIRSRALIKQESDDYLIAGPSYQSLANLCPGNPFAEQTSAAFCSGFLVAPNLILTAGHCLRDQLDCAQTQIVFDFALTDPGQKEMRVSVSSVYQCAEIVSRSTGDVDYALLRLDRAVDDRQPLAIRQQGSPALGDPMAMVGHPMGLPSKIVQGATVLGLGARYFISVDAFAANSGSPVINPLTGRVEGLLVTGESDFIVDGECRRERVCDGACRGEGVMPLTNIPALKDLPDYPASPTCALDVDQ